MATSTKASRAETGDAEQSSNAWIPAQPGDALEGELIDVRLAWSDFRESEYPILGLRTDTGAELAFHAFRTVAYREVADKQPLPGERIRITYHGRGKARNGMSAPELYRLTVEGRSAEESARRAYARLQGARHEPQPQAPADIPERGEEDNMPF